MLQTHFLINAMGIFQWFKAVAALLAPVWLAAPQRHPAVSARHLWGQASAECVEEISLFKAFQW